jgi:hypothetical protein
MNSFISAKIVPLFYLLIGLIFLCFPEIPHKDIISGEKIKGEEISLTFTREIGVLFIVIAILIWKIHSISKSVYRLLNSTFLVVMILLAAISVMMYFLIPGNPQQLIFTTLINIAFFFIYLWERKQ